MCADNMKNVAWKILPWALDALVGVCLYIQLGMLSDIQQLRDDVNRIREWQAATNANRYTMSDAAVMQDRHTGELTKVWSKIADMQQQWLRDIGEIKVSVAEIKAEVKAGGK